MAYRLYIATILLALSATAWAGGGDIVGFNTDMQTDIAIEFELR